MICSQCIQRTLFGRTSYSTLSRLKSLSRPQYLILTHPFPQWYTTTTTNAPHFTPATPFTPISPATPTISSTLSTSTSHPPAPAPYLEYVPPIQVQNEGGEVANEITSPGGLHVQIGLQETSAEKQVLLLAAYRGDRSAIQEWISRFGNEKAKSAVDDYGNGILHWAAYGKQHEIINFVFTHLGLTKQDLDSASNHRGLSPLFIASFFGNVACIRTLADLGAKLDATDASGNTVMHYAAKKGSAGAIRELAELGASVDTPSNVGHLPLNYAGGNPATTQALIECGADVKARGSRMESPLHSAVSAEVVKVLVKAGADLEAREIEGYTPLCSAAAQAECEQIAALLDLGASIHARTKGIGFTPFLLAVLSSQVPAAELLLARGANVRDCDATAGWSAVHCAAKYGNAQMVRKLVEKGAEVDAVDKDGFTPWMYMVSEDRNWEIARLLVELGADVNHKTADQQTMLHWIIHSDMAPASKLEAVQQVIQMRANVEERDAQGRTPIMCARSEGVSSDVIALLQGTSS